MLVHASCAARGADAVLFLGPPGCGKSDLVFRLLDRGWRLVADDQVQLGPPVAAPAPLAGMLEVRGLGIFRGLAAPEQPVTLRLAIELGSPTRLPAPRLWQAGGIALPCVTLAAFAASAPQQVEWALDAALGRRAMAAGAFAA
jgi:hypothetical protein